MINIDVLKNDYNETEIVGDENYGENSIYTVTEKAMRSSSENCACFYCGQEIGKNHKQDCELVCKKVKIKASVEYYITVPSTWGGDEVENYRKNIECGDILLQELMNIKKEKGCLCGIVNFEYLGDESNSYIDENFDVYIDW